MAPDKKWLSYIEQANLLSDRGLNIEDKAQCEEFLSQVNYYRLSGYFRYWQLDPGNGDNRFMKGSDFTRIRDLYLAEEKLKAACIPLLYLLEVLLRNRFAHFYGNLVGATDSFARGEGLTQPPNRFGELSREGVERHALRNLDHSKETFISHYRDVQDETPPYRPSVYTHMPIWVAVEAFSFGSLSKLIVASKESGVLNAISESMSVSRRDLPSQVRSFVYLRNRISHCAKLWNHAVIDKPALQPAQIRRAKRGRKFDDNSIYKIIIAMDSMAKKSGISDTWLEETISPILDSSPLLTAGIATPRKYGDMPSELLV